MDSGLSASDVLALTKNNDGMFGGDSWAWIILVLLLGGGGVWGNNRNDYITSPQFESANQFQALDRQLSGITYGLADSTFALNNSVVNEGRSLQTQIANCCCETQKAIHAEGEATRALIQQNKIEALQQKINALELANATSNVVRYPTTYAYSAGPSPFCAAPCGCGNI
jgi:hypothetical protein